MIAVALNERIKVIFILVLFLIYLVTNLDIITYNGDMERRWHDDFRLSKNL